MVVAQQPGWLLDHFLKRLIFLTNFAQAKANRQLCTVGHPSLTFHDPKVRATAPHAREVYPTSLQEEGFQNGLLGPISFFFACVCNAFAMQPTNNLPKPLSVLRHSQNVGFASWSSPDYPLKLTAVLHRTSTEEESSVLVRWGNRYA